MIINRKINVPRSNKNTQTHQPSDPDIQNKAKEETVYMYGGIGGYFGIDHLEFIKDFNAMDASVIHLRIDSSGGDIFAARAMKTAIMQHKAKVIAHIDGLAASAASFIAMGADEIEIVEGGFIMIHNALSFMDVFGHFNIDDLEDLKTTIDREMTLHGQINESIANDYISKTGNPKAQIETWMSEETWFTAEEALENNFVDRVYDGDPVEGSYDLSIFAEAPESLQARNTKASKRDVERALRDVGLSNKVAKAILTGLSADNLRDEDLEAIDPDADTDDQRDVDPVIVDNAEPEDRVQGLVKRVEKLALEV